MADKPTPTSLNVAIIGAGIAGLAAAISMRRAGHNVTIYERSSFKVEVGAAINMPPQATRIMRSWDIPIPASADCNDYPTRSDGRNYDEQSTFGGTMLSKTQRINFATARSMPGQNFPEIESRFGAPFVSYHRADLHTLLRTKAEVLGAVIVLSSPVNDIDCRNGMLWNSREDGQTERVQKDILILADGINTSFVPSVVAKDVPLDRTGRMCFRMLIRMSKILSNPVARAMYSSKGVDDGDVTGIHGVSGSMNPKTGVMLIQYPCREGELMNVAIFDRPREDRKESTDWNSPATLEDALEPIQDFNEGFRALVGCAETVKAFNIALRDPLPIYVNGRAVLIGDAAHPMLPPLAGGGSTSLEDAAALGILFSDVSNNDFDTIRSRLTLFNALRLPRDVTQQVISNSMFQPRPASALEDKIKPFYTGELPDKVLGGWTKETCEFVCGYDVFEETMKAKRRAEGQGWRDVGSLPDGLVQHFGTLS